MAEAYKNVWADCAGSVGCGAEEGQLGCLQAVSVDDLWWACGSSIAVAADGWIVPNATNSAMDQLCRGEDPFGQGSIPLLVGSNRDEARYFIMGYADASEAASASADWIPSALHTYLEVNLGLFAGEEGWTNGSAHCAVELLSARLSAAYEGVDGVLYNTTAFETDYMCTRPAARPPPPTSRSSQSPLRSVA